MKIKKTIVYGKQQESGVFLRVYNSLHKLALCENLNAKLLKLTVVEAKNQKENKKQGNEPDYWGWWSNKDKEFCYIYPSKHQVEMCFVYGSKIEEEKGEGKLLRLEIKSQSQIYIHGV